MLLDFEVRSCSRVCAQSGKALLPSEVYFSVLEVEEAETVRRDYAAEAWQGPPKGSLGWWRSRVPSKNEKPKLAPTEVMLNLFIALAGKPNDVQFRYLLGLLLIRRRVLRREEASCDDAGQEVLTVFVPRRDQRFELLVDEPNQEQAEKIQQRMIDLLYGDGEAPIHLSDSTAELASEPASESNPETEAA